MYVHMYMYICNDISYCCGKVGGLGFLVVMRIGNEIMMY